MRSYHHILSCVSLGVLVLGVFGQTLSFDYVGFDDPEYVTTNPMIREGLTWPGIRSVFTEGHFGNWHPLTSLSLMLDCQIAGLKPAAGHASNVLIHLMNAWLLYWLLVALTGETWAAWAVAALFAIHPFHVQSVSWISSRKDLLSAFFAFGALLLHSRYARKPGWGGYLLTWVCLCFALMSKATMVVLPCLMLLLDFWPLGRIGREEGERSSRAETFWRQLAWCGIEKIPMFIAAAGVSWVTYVLQRQTGFTEGLPGISLGHRLVNALVAYAVYLGKTIVPIHFAMFYPYPQHYPARVVVPAVVVLAGITVFALHGARKRPFVLVGWGWYLVSLLPMIGLIQVGDQAYADRYTYTALIGFFVMAAWTLKETASRCSPLRSSWGRRGIGVVAAAVLLLLSGIAWRETGYWRDSMTLFSHAIQVTKDNYVAEFNLGNTLLEKKQYEKAEIHLRNAIRAKSDFPDPVANLGVLKSAQGKNEEAIALYQEVLDRYPAYTYRSRTQANLGAAYIRTGQWSAAEGVLGQVVQSEEGDASAFYSYGVALAQQGKDGAALKAFAVASDMKPPYVRADYEWGKLALRQGKLEEAKARFERYLHVCPEDASAHVDAGVTAGMLGQVASAIPHFQEAIRLNPDHADAHYNLGLALAAVGRADEAIREFRETIRLRPGDKQAAQQLEALVKP